MARLFSEKIEDVMKQNIQNPTRFQVGLQR